MARYAQWPSEVSDIGIGEDIIRVQAEEAYKKRFESFDPLSIAGGKRAIRIHEKLVQCGRTLKKLFKEGRRIDETIMTKWLE